MTHSSASFQTSTTPDDSGLLKQQLMREIACLERQLERVRSRDEFADYTTLQTYEEMIGSRRKMLGEL